MPSRDLYRPDQWLQTPLEDLPATTDFLGAIEGVRRARRLLWQRSERAAGEGEAALADGIELQALLVGWRAVHKRLAKLSQPPLHLALPEALRSACNQLSRAARFDSTRFAAVLWKRGGHPAAARSLEQLNAQTELLDLAAPLRLSTECVGSSLLSEQPSHLALWADAELRHELLTAVCTIE